VIAANSKSGAAIMVISKPRALIDVSRLLWFKRDSAIAKRLANTAWDHRPQNGHSTAAADPGQFISEFFGQFSSLHRLANVGEQHRRYRLAVLLDRTLDMKIIGDFLLGSSKSKGTRQERQAFDHRLRDYIADSVRARIGNFRQLRIIDHYQDGIATLVVAELISGPSSLYSEWIVAAKPEGWRLYNLVIGGVNLAHFWRETIGRQEGPDGSRLIGTDNLPRYDLSALPPGPPGTATSTDCAGTASLQALRHVRRRREQRRHRPQQRIDFIR
jgi:hypothetical protein